MFLKTNKKAVILLKLSSFLVNFSYQVPKKEEASQIYNFAKCDSAQDVKMTLHECHNDSTFPEWFFCFIFIFLLLKCSRSSKYFKYFQYSHELSELNKLWGWKNEAQEQKLKLTFLLILFAMFTNVWRDEFVLQQAALVEGSNDMVRRRLW